MELVRVVRLLWRRRIALAAGFVAAAALAVVGGRTTLAWRAALLSHLLAAGTGRQALARRIGVPVDQLAVVDQELAAPAVPSSLPKAVSAAIVPRAPYAVSVSMPNGAVPIIAIEAYAPDRSGAVRLARASAQLLQSQSSPDAVGPGVQPLVIESAAPIHARTLSGGGPLRRAAVFVLLWGLWTAAVALGPLLV